MATDVVFSWPTGTLHARAKSELKSLLMGNPHQSGWSRLMLIKSKFWSLLKHRHFFFTVYRVFPLGGLFRYQLIPPKDVFKLKTAVTSFLTIFYQKKNFTIWSIYFDTDKSFEYVFHKKCLKVWKKRVFGQKGEFLP